MIEVCKNLLSALYAHNIEADCLPLDFDYSDVGKFYILNDDIEEEGCKDYSLEIHLATLTSNKINLYPIADDIEKVLLEKGIGCTYRVFKKNIPRNTYTEKEITTLILEFYVREYKL